MGIVLGDNRYGKAGIRLVHVTRRGEWHDLRDLTVHVALSGDFEAAHLSGDNTSVLPTDSQRNAVYALAAGTPPGEIEDFALRLGRHFVAGHAPVERAVIRVEEQPWSRIPVAGAPHPHSFQRGSERRLAVVTCQAGEAWVVSGLEDLALLKTTGSEFRGFARDRYTTLEETDDRILATGVSARWRHRAADAEWAGSFAEARRALLETFAGRYSRSLQQTLYEMGRALLEACPEVAEVRLALPNLHHLPAGPAGATAVYQALDRPHGLIEGTVRREDAPAAPAWLDW